MRQDGSRDMDVSIGSPKNPGRESTKLERRALPAGLEKSKVKKGKGVQHVGYGEMEGGG